MMLRDAEIERWSRQILVPEVGGRGQARLRAARSGVLGDGGAARATVDLLRRAGVAAAAGVVPPAAQVLVDLAGDSAAGLALARTALAARAPLVRGTLAGAAGCVLTLVGGPCGVCVEPWGASRDGAPVLAPPAVQALAALAAGEVLGALLWAPRRGRRQWFDLARGDFGGEVLTGGGCDACGGTT